MEETAAINAAVQTNDFSNSAERAGQLLFWSNPETTCPLVHPLARQACLFLFAERDRRGFAEERSSGSVQNVTRVIQTDADLGEVRRMHPLLETGGNNSTVLAFFHETDVDAYWAAISALLEFLADVLVRYPARCTVAVLSEGPALVDLASAVLLGCYHGWAPQVRKERDLLARALTDPMTHRPRFAAVVHAVLACSNDEARGSLSSRMVAWDGVSLPLARKIGPERRADTAQLLCERLQGELLGLFLVETARTPVTESSLQTFLR